MSELRQVKEIRCFASAAFDHACVAYVVWVLFGVLAFVTHLGDDLMEMVSTSGGSSDEDANSVLFSGIFDWSTSVPHLRRLLVTSFYLLPAGGRADPSKAVDNWVEFFGTNLTYAAIFVGQHSFMRLLKTSKGYDESRFQARLLRSALGWLKSRIAYNVFSALTLHLFLINYAPYRQQEPLFGMIPTELCLPISAEMHALFAFVVMIPAFMIFLVNPSTGKLLYGEGSASGESVAKMFSSASNVAFRSSGKKQDSSMDVITQMAHCVHKRLGIAGFVLFSGVSIVPRTIQIDDVVVRVVAAIYLRQRSAHFRLFSKRVAGSHEAAWLARALILGSGVCARLMKREFVRTELQLSIGAVLIGIACLVLMRLK
eukprot:TRINITY_DN37456_c0_g1_i1.p1 TRINITY_DN37456_c0_g1~~TRINITY_DN37456_c0_g1_i1.p1  ORF type:complete len:386 (-),score=42.26 TRINITY_DN37456_c0_g1_i1:186-1298(-)